ncbi:MAG: dihydrodipicolinate synthase family protein, partial [Proteobacteria bacterium]|nr:dihydrodipicolinate synthase family protein [Pseudomonadota bacterium]
MQPQSPQGLHGLWAPILPPFRENGELDRDAFSTDLDRLLDAGLNGIDDGGTRTEALDLTRAESQWVAETVAARCAIAGCPFQLGVASQDPDEARAQIASLSGLSPTAIAVVLPADLPPAHQDFISTIQSYAQAAGSVGIVLDHHPHPRLEFPPELAAPMREAAPNVIGVRVGLGTEDWYESWRKNSSGLSLIVPGHHHATGVQRGADGAYSTFALLSPQGARLIGELTLTDLPKALELEADLQFFLISHLLPLQIEEGYSCAALDKALAAAGGFCGGSSRLRSPHAWLSAEQVASLAESAKQELPWFFEAAADAH